MSVLDRIALALATGFGFGFSPILPGTCGALWGLPLSWIVFQLPSLPLIAAAIAAGLLVGVPICQRAAALLGGKKDPGAVVWDEIATMPIVFLGVPIERLGAGEWAAADWRLWAAGFLLHRIFDIAKPPPIRSVERFPGGWGIMADDVLAAIAAAVVLRVLLIWL